MELEEKTPIDSIKLIEKNKAEAIKKQHLLVSENPFVACVDNETYIKAKKSRTAYVKGRTSLQGELKLVKSFANDFKSTMVDEYGQIIEISMPSENKQQAEVKRYEDEKEQKRVAAEKQKEEDRKAAFQLIDDLIGLSQKEVDSMTYENINIVENNVQACINDLPEMDEEFMFHAQGKHKILVNEFEGRRSVLVSQRKNKETAQENDILRIDAHWTMAISLMKAKDVQGLNEEFDRKIPLLNPLDFNLKSEFFNETVKRLRDLITNKSESLKKEIEKLRLEQVEAQKAEEEEKQRNLNRDIVRTRYAEAKEAIEKLPLYGYEETIQAVEEKIILIQVEGNDPDLTQDCEDKKEALNAMMKVRISEIKEEVRLKKEEEEAAEKLRLEELKNIPVESHTVVPEDKFIDLNKVTNEIKGSIISPVKEKGPEEIEPLSVSTEERKYSKEEDAIKLMDFLSSLTFTKQSPVFKNKEFETLCRDLMENVVNFKNSHKEQFKNHK